MNNIKLMLSMVIISLVLSGCAKQVSYIINTSKSEGNSITLARDKKNPDDSITINDTASMAGNVPTKHIESTNKSDKLNSQLLKKLSNTKYSWWLKQNRVHKTPGFPPESKKFVDKYGSIYIGDTSKKVVYLTFDEGYENGYTHEILDTLKSNNVKAIFFITGPYIKSNPYLVKRMLDEGHQIGNHTINHLSLPSLSDSAFVNETFGLEKRLNQKFGKGMKYLRPPMGQYSERTLAAAQQLGYKTVFWSLAYLDYDIKNQKGSDYAYKKVMDNLHNGAIILLHAVSKDNTDALDRIIKGIKSEGFEIKPFDL